MALTIIETPVDATEEDEVRSGRATERDDNQIKLDGMVLELKGAWEASGRTALDTLRTKAGFKHAMKKSVTVGAEDRSAVKAMIRRACTLHKVTPVYANDKTNDDGTVRIKFTVGPYVPRKRGDTTATETPASADAPQTADAGAQDAEMPAETPDAPTGDGNPDAGSWGRRRR